jgi:hypothetical protein
METVVETFARVKLDDLDFKEENEWVLLCSNYSKLRYLNEIIDHFYIKSTDRFVYSLGIFMENVTKTNIIYLNQIDWKQSDLEEECDDIKQFLERSIYTDDCIQKLKLVLRAYRLLVPIVEEYRNEKFVDKIDRVFLDNFKIK